MIQHSKSVKLGIKKSLMVVDMPYLTYKNKKEALKRMVDLFKNSAKLAKRRIKTKPSSKAQKKRMDSKIKREFPGRI